MLMSKKSASAKQRMGTYDVSKKQAVDLLRASLVTTSCALSTALGDFIAKKAEPVCETPQLRRSQRKKQKVSDCQSS
ncbi:unnamed protein product [Eruca vesicaria subsp. sativa]|uniref:Uncharacterized protein n=1 Tax=Eruca vesicaria subsp. sativa TaxID=29727 RepID=A0ABC8KBB5_ERUVS|nr:unnamed protein product [Eruca vesicaria subsp. sativa]